MPNFSNIRVLLAATVKQFFSATHSGWLSVVAHSLQLSVTFLKSIKILRNYRRIRNSVFSTTRLLDSEFH